MSWVEDVRAELQSLSRREGACGICHDVLEMICKKGGKAVTYERPDGVIAKIYDDKGEVVGEGKDIVSASAILSAELDAGVIPEPFASELSAVVTSEEDLRRTGEIYGYGRVITPASIALEEAKKIGGRTVIRREGIGVVAQAFDAQGNTFFKSPVCYCPVCAVVIGASRNEELAKKIRERLAGKRNTGKIKYEQGVENIYEMEDGKVFVSIKRGNEMLAERVLACCMVYGMVKAEVVAGFSPKESAQQFKAYCNICPLKHCWVGKSVGSLGNIVLNRLSEINVEVEVSIDGLIRARIPGNGVIEGRGTLCTLSALTNMLLREDAVKILRPKRGSAPEHEL